jgi:uncharacterized protein (TIGR03118 family)
MIQTVRGRFRDFDRAIVAGDEPSVSGSIRVASLETLNEERDAHLRSPDFFDAERYPEVSFRSDRLHFNGDDSRFALAGELTIKGVTRPITLDGELHRTVVDADGSDRMALVLRGFSCPCHGSQFDNEGSRIAGPAPRAPPEARSPAVPGRPAVMSEGARTQTNTKGETMKLRRSAIVLGVIVALAASIALSASADGGGIATRSYVQTNLVSDIPGLAAHTDANLKNPWGTSVGPGGPIWVSDNHAGVTTLYDGAGNPQPRVVAIPAPPSAGTGAVGAPTGQAFNTFDPTSTEFVISANGKSGPAFFLFATEDGTIAGWNPNVDNAIAVIAVDRSTATDGAGDVGANYKGLALVTTPNGKFIYATSFRFGTVDVFDSHFNLVNSFTDPTIPAGFAPFGIHNIGGKLYVTFAKQGPGKNDDAARPGNGFVDVFAPNGDLLQRLVSRGKLDSPWAVTLAPPTFGAFGGDILVGNFGNGRINAYDPTSGEFQGELSTPGRGPIAIDGLWGLRFAPATPGAGPNTLFFTAGLNDEADGLFGTILPNG